LGLCAKPSVAIIGKSSAMAAAVLNTFGLILIGSIAGHGLTLSTIGGSWASHNRDRSPSGVSLGPEILKIRT
jgi:hypothetical protein